MSRPLVHGVLIAGLVCSGLGCRAPGVFHLSRADAQAQTLSDPITLLSWNTRKGLDPEWRDAFVALVERESPDLIFLQEASTDLYPSNAPPASVYFGGSWSYPWPGERTTGVMIASQTPLHTVDVLQSKWREFFVTAPKASMVARAPLKDGVSLLLANVHLLNFERWGTEQFETQLSALKQAVVDHHGPVIIAGDFNTWNMSRLLAVHRIADELGLRELDPFDGLPKTGELPVAWANRVLGIEPHLSLARVFYRGLEPVHAQVLSLQASDHPPLLVTFRRSATTSRPLARVAGRPVASSVPLRLGSSE